MSSEPTIFKAPVGYVVIPHANNAVYRILGKYHTISFLPDDVVATLGDDTVITMWSDSTDMNFTIWAYLIHPHKYCRILGSLTPQEGSTIAELSTCETKDMTTSTAIASDLFQINKRPCILFIRDIGDEGTVYQEAQNLCFATRVLQNIDNLIRFLESTAMQPGDAVFARFMSQWYSSTTSDLREERKTAHHQYLFDPTILAVGILLDLGQTLRDAHGLDIISCDILIPMPFIRSWAECLRKKVKDDISYLSKLAKTVL